MKWNNKITREYMSRRKIRLAQCLLNASIASYSANPN